MTYDWDTLAQLRSKLFALLWTEHADDVRNLDLLLIGDTFVLRGEVGSEQAKSDAKRFALGFDGVFKVRNELEVAGYFVPASDTTGDDYFGTGETSQGKSFGDGAVSKRATSDRTVASDLEEVSRYPTVHCEGHLSPGERIRLTVDLSEHGAPGESPIMIGDFPAGWSRIDIDVQIFAPWASELEAMSPRIVLKRAESEAAVFHLTVASTYVSGTPAIVQISFLDGTRICGHVARDLAPSDDSSEGDRRGDESPARNVAHASARDAAMGDVRVQLGAPGPTLTLTIVTQCDGRQTWMWNARLAKTQVAGSAVANHRSEEKEFAAELLASCPDLRDGEFRRVMAGVGERVWRASPEDFRAAYMKCRREVGPGFPIQLVTADPFVPWEMMKPDLEDLEADHLFFEHPICRWPLNAASGLRSEMVSADRLTFVPTYPGADDLPAARAEGEWLERTLRAVRMTADRATFLNVLDGNHSERIGMLHFAGHGRADSGVKDGGIRLQDGWVGVNEVDQSQVRLGRKDWPLVVLNACESGSGGRFLGMNVGWGTTIANRGFGGLIAPLWEVHDDVAFDVMRRTLQPLASGRSTLGEAATEARRSQSDRSISSFAYLAHGDVMARFVD